MPDAATRLGMTYLEEPSMQFVTTTLVGLALVFAATTAQGGTKREAPLANVKVSVENGGFNPDAFAYGIEADALIAGNPCEAQGLKVDLKTKRKGRTLAVTAVVTGRAKNRICPRIFQPVYRRVATTVRGFQSRIDDVIVRNVEELGTDLSVADLLNADADLAQLTGTLVRVMAIGGESTGTALMLADGSTVEIDLVEAGLEDWGMTAEGLVVSVTGRYVDVEGVEIPLRRVLVVESLELAGE
jgi:hypothetical protein